MHCINFVCKCRVVVQNLNSTIAALRLGDADEWHQIFTDVKSRRQISFQNLVVAFMLYSRLNPAIVSSCMFLEDDTSENQVKSIVKQVRYNLNILCQSTSLS